MSAVVVFIVLTVGGVLQMMQGAVQQSGFFAMFLAAVNACVVYWLIVPFVRRNVIGRYVWVYRDSNEEIHAHIRLPRWFRQKINNKTAGVFLRVRVGGWLKTNDVHGPKADKWLLDSWDVSERRRGDLVLRDTDGGAMTVTSFTQLFWILENADSIALFQGLAKATVAAIPVITVDKKAVKALALMTSQRDLLGVEMMKLVALMRRSSDTMGKSKHAQLVRTRIEKLIFNLPVNIKVEWRTRAEAELLVEEKHADPSEPLSS